MQKPDSHYASWIKIAEEDLVSAKLLANEDLSTALFHVQQCVEKTLKGYVFFKNHPNFLTHNLLKLVFICMRFDPSFETLAPLAAEITPYAFVGRYPDASFQKPDQKQMHEITVQAEYVFNFVITKIKSATSPCQRG